MTPELSHRCLACGRSCHGVVVRLFSDEEEPVRRAAEALGVHEPVVNGALRQEGGACVFLQPDQRCAIHATLGFDQKPRLCRQYPLVHVRTEHGERWGIDPGCYTWPQTAHEAPRDLSADDLVSVPIALPEEGVELERRLLHPSLTSLQAYAEVLAPGRDLVRWRARWVRVLRGTPTLSELLRRPDAGRHVGEALLPALAASADWEDDPPPEMPDPVTEWITVETVRRFLHLRLAPRVPPPVLVEALLGGGLLRAWTDPEDDRITSAWSRAVRAPVFLSRWFDAWQATPE